MSGGRRSWSAGVNPAARLGAAVVASAALHLSVIPGLAFGPGDAGLPAEPLRARLARESARPSPGAEREPDSAPAPGSRTGRTPASRTDTKLPVPADDRYFTASELDHRPVPLMQVEPRYPGDAAARLGRVVLELFIDQDGRVDKVVVVSGERPFDESALWAFGQARFSPGVRRGAPVKSRMLIEVLYRPDEAPAPRSPGGEG